MELRCGSRLHGVVQGDVFETTCKSHWCGWKPGLVVLHRFNVKTGELAETLIFKNPTTRKESKDESTGDRVSVRSA